MTKYGYCGVIRQFIVFRELVWEMTKRDLKMLNKGSILGLAWLVVGFPSGTTILAIRQFVEFEAALIAASRIPKSARYQPRQHEATQNNHNSDQRP